MKYKCEGCGAVLNSEEIILKPFPKNFNIIGRSVMVKNTLTNKICMTGTDKLVDGDCVLHCPKCDQVHLFGFNRYFEPTGVAV